MFDVKTLTQLPASRAIGRVLAATAVVLSGASGAVAQVVQGGGGSLAELVRAAGPAVVVVRAIDGQGHEFAQGSGFIAADHRVVTNAHVVAGAAIAEVVSAEGATLERATYAEELNEQADVAVLPRVRSSVRGLELATAAPEPGDRIVVIGSPEGLSNTVSDGIVSGARRIGGQALIQISAPISHGSSGGPVVDMAGHVVGIATLFLNDGQLLNFAVPASQIRALLNAAPTRLPFPPDERATTATKTTAPSGATAQCRDGTYSFSAHRRGTCSHHGGVATWLRTVAP